MAGFDEPLWTRVALAGWTGVDLFFVLSGFLITGILLDTRGGRGYFRSFYARRTLRVFPLYYAALFGLFALLPALGLLTITAHEQLAGPQAWYWTYLTNVWIAANGWEAVTPYTSHFWSLAVEEQFYLVWPFVVLTLGDRRLLPLCIAGVALAPLLRAALLWQGVDPVAVYVLTPTRFDTLMAGSGLAAWLRRDADPALLRSFAKWAIAAGSCTAVAIVVSNGRFGELDPIVQIAGYSAVTMLSTGLLAGLVDPRSRGPLTGLFAWRPARLLGRYSYGIYVVHPPVIFATLLTLGSTLRPLREAAGPFALCAVIGVIAGAASIGIAALSHHCFERRFLALKKHFPYPRDRGFHPTT